MKVEVTDNSKVEKQIDVQVPAERVDDTIEEQYDEIQRTAHVKGFRPGKVPRKILEKLFRDYVMQKTMEKLVRETLEPALERKQIKPVAEPVIDPAEVEPGADFAYTMHVEVSPDVELNEYTGIEVTHKEDVVSDEDVEKAIENLQENFATIKEPEEERAVTAEDQVSAKLAVKEDGEVIEGSEDEEQVIDLWRETWIPGLVDELTGKKPGDKFEFEADIPEDETVPEKFRGKKLTFSIEVTGLKERSLPEINDEFAKDYTRFETMEELRENVRKSLEENVSEQNKNALHQSILEKLLEKNPVEVPPSLVKGESNRMAQDFMSRNLGKQPTAEEAQRFAPMFEEESKKGLAGHFLLEAIIEKEGIEASDEDLEAELEKHAENAGMHVDKLKARLEERDTDMMKERIRVEKALDFLVARATIKDEAAES